jgi:hypothetical protein
MFHPRKTPLIYSPVGNSIKKSILMLGPRELKRNRGYQSASEVEMLRIHQAFETLPIDSEVI